MPFKSCSATHGCVIDDEHVGKCMNAVGCEEERGRVRPVAELRRTSEDKPDPNPRVVVYDYYVDQPVKIKGTGIEAFVDSCLVEHNGDKQYRIIYWMNGQRNNVWVYAPELTAV